MLLLASSSLADGFDSFVSKGIVGVCCTLLLTVVTLSGGLEVVPIDDIDVVVSGRLLVVELVLKFYHSNISLKTGLIFHEKTRELPGDAVMNVSNE